MSSAKQKTSSSSSSGKKEEGNPDLNLPGIGNYTFERTVGQGNFAKVKLAKHKLTAQEVAIKIIDKTTFDEKKLAKLHREVRIMKMLQHPNIVKLFEVIETKHTLFLVMEYVSGGELYDYLVAHGRMKEKEARIKFRQILSAVNYCHKKRIIHRDLKAENLLLDANLNIKIADFGFSNNYNPEGQLDTFCGSPPYAAPELFQGKNYIGPEVDIWSLGVILYVLCTGCLPFDGKDLKEMREVVCRGRYKVPFYISDTCEKLLRKFLVRDSTKRATLDMLIDDPWINDGFTESPITAEVLPDPIKSLDEEVIRFMCDKFTLTRDQIIKSLEDNNYDDISAIYLLLLDQKSSGKWSSYNSQGLTPMSPVQLQQGTASPVSKAPIDMGTIGEEGTENADKFLTPQLVSRRPGNVASARPTGGARPVTWMVPDGQQPNAPAQAAQDAGLRVPPPAHTRAPTAPANGPTVEEEEKKGGAVMNAIRNIGRRLTVDSSAAQAMATQAVTNHQNGQDENRPRSLRFTFNSSTTSSKAPEDLVKEITTSCSSSMVHFTMRGKFLIECTWNFRDYPLSKTAGGQKDSMNVDQLQKALAEVMSGSGNDLADEDTSRDLVRFEIEVCELPRLRNLHGLRFKRTMGPSAQYKDICERILSTVRL